VGFIPFPAALLGAYGTRRIAVIVYGASLTFTGLTLALIWWHAAHHRRLVSQDLSSEAVANGFKRLLVGPIIYVAAIILSFVSVWLSLAAYVIALIFYILPGRIDRHWRGAGDPTKKAPNK
jgi:uncharacterized membrane protein